MVHQETSTALFWWEGISSGHSCLRPTSSLHSRKNKHSAGACWEWEMKIGAFLSRVSNLLLWAISVFGRDVLLCKKVVQVLLIKPPLKGAWYFYMAKALIVSFLRWRTREKEAPAFQVPVYWTKRSAQPSICIPHRVPVYSTEYLYTTLSACKLYGTEAPGAS